MCLSVSPIKSKALPRQQSLALPFSDAKQPLLQHRRHPHNLHLSRGPCLYLPHISNDNFNETCSRLLIKTSAICILHWRVGRSWGGNRRVERGRNTAGNKQNPNKQMEAPHLHNPTTNGCQASCPVRLRGESGRGRCVASLCTHLFFAFTCWDFSVFRNP